MNVFSCNDTVSINNTADAAAVESLNDGSQAPEADHVVVPSVAPQPAQSHTVARAAASTNTAAREKKYQRLVQTTMVYVVLKCGVIVRICVS